MNSKITIAALTSLALILGTTQAFAFGHGKGKGGDVLTDTFFGKAHCALESSDKLGLSEDQVSSIRSLKVDVKKAVVRQKADCQISDIDLYSALKQDTVDIGVVEKLVDQKYEGKKALAKTLTDSYVKLKGILTADQWQTLETLEKKKMKAWKKGGGDCAECKKHHRS